MHRARSLLIVLPLLDIVFQARFGISNEDAWTGKDETFNYQIFFNIIVGLFDDSEDSWCKETLEYWNR